MKVRDYKYFTKYFARDGRQIDAKTWSKLLRDLDYCAVRMFENDKVRVVLDWTGIVPNADQFFPDHYPVYSLHVDNYNHAGEPFRDPVEDGRTFPNEAVAITAYEKFLKKWTDSFIDEEGKFVDLGNEAKPPAPPSLDAPTSSVKSIKGMENDDVGVW
jgi:hypothetical protein